MGISGLCQELLTQILTGICRESSQRYLEKLALGMRNWNYGSSKHSFYLSLQTWQREPSACKMGIWFLYLVFLYLVFWSLQQQIRGKLAPSPIPAQNPFADIIRLISPSCCFRWINTILDKGLAWKLGLLDYFSLFSCPAFPAVTSALFALILWFF